MHTLANKVEWMGRIPPILSDMGRSQEVMKPKLKPSQCWKPKPNDLTEKKSGAKTEPGAVSWYVTQLNLWHYFGATFKGGAVFV